MSQPLPQNSAEAAYIAFAMVDELIRLLVQRGTLDALNVESLLESVTKRLLEAPNFDAERAAKFVADRVPRKE